MSWEALEGWALTSWRKLAIALFRPHRRCICRCPIVLSGYFLTLGRSASGVRACGRYMDTPTPMMAVCKWCLPPASVVSNVCLIGYAWHVLSNTCCGTLFVANCVNCDCSGRKHRKAWGHIIASFT
eukprot:6194373-Pleurochrysis_carterae.AAC.3